MNAALSMRERRAIAVGGAALCLVLLTTVGAPRALRWRDSTRGTAGSVISELSREQASIRQAKAMRDSLVQRQVQLMALDSALLEGDSPALAGAALAELLSDASETYKVQLGAIQIREDTTQRKVFALIQAQTSATGTLTAVASFLAHIESGAKLLLLRDATFTSQLTPDKASASGDVLKVDVVIEGLSRPHKTMASR
jgi:hypothetical protein